MTRTSDHPSPLRDVVDRLPHPPGASEARFGTRAFDHAVMHSLVGRRAVAADEPAIEALDHASWLRVVPDRYRPAVLDMITRLSESERFRGRGRPAGAALHRALVEELYWMIWDASF